MNIDAEAIFQTSSNHIGAFATIAIIFMFLASVIILITEGFMKAFDLLDAWATRRAAVRTSKAPSVIVSGQIFSLPDGEKDLHLVIEDGKVFHNGKEIKPDP